MKKLLSIMLISLMLIALLTACGTSENTDKSTDTNTNTNENTNIGENLEGGDTENDNVNEGEKPDVGDTGNDNTIDTSIKVEYDAEREASDNEFPFDNIIVERNGYDIVSAGKYYGDDFDNIIYYGSYYRIIDNYNDFSELTAWGNKIDESVFEDSFVLVLYTYKNYDVYYSPSEFYDFNNLYNRGCFENFEIDKNTNKMKIDETWVANFYGSPFYGPPAPSIADCEILIPIEKHETIYLLIPKTELKDEMHINGEIELEMEIWRDE